MIKRMAIVTVWVLDQDEAVDFYTNKLGFEIRTDASMGDMRWVTLGPKDQPDVDLTLMVPQPPMVDAESAEQIRALCAKGVLGAGVFRTDDCHATYRELSARGVEFVQEPQERPYGIEAIFRDNTGNWFSLTQHRSEM